MSDLAVGQ